MMKEQFLKAFAEALERQAPLHLEDEFRSLPDWDSLSHMSLIAMLDTEFNVQMETAEFERMKTVGDLLRFVESKSGS